MDFRCGRRRVRAVGIFHVDTYFFPHAGSPGRAGARGLGDFQIQNEKQFFKGPMLAPGRTGCSGAGDFLIQQKNRISMLAPGKGGAFRVGPVPETSPNPNPPPKGTFPGWALVGFGWSLRGGGGSNPSNHPPFLKREFFCVGPQGRQDRCSGPRTLPPGRGGNAEDGEVSRKNKKKQFSRLTEDKSRKQGRQAVKQQESWEL